MDTRARARWHPGAVFASVLLCLLPLVLRATPQAAAPTALLATADDIKTSDHARFLDLLQQLHRIEGQLSPLQREQLRFLDAWQDAYAGNYARANAALESIAQRALDRDLAIRAKAMLVHDNFVERHYETAYSIADALMAELPSVTDPATRREVLSQVVQMLQRGNQYDLALIYAQQMKAEASTDKARCVAMLHETQTRLHGDGKLASSDPAFDETIEICLAARRTVFANAMRLDRADLMTDEGHPQRAISLLQRVAPEIRKAGYQFHIAELHTLLARAWLHAGNNENASNEAMKAVAGNPPDAVNWNLQQAYEVLYKVEHARGHDDAALAWHEKYLQQYKASTEDARASSLAYQMVKQEVQNRKQKLDALDKENRILQLRQSLDEKAAETTRLYIALLLLALAFIGAWVWRLKHSQIRLRKLARHDSLTGTLNRQHFLEDAGRTLARLQKSAAPACLTILDLDHFKAVNDNHGHAAGDHVLQCTVSTIRAELRGSDVFGRLGGEEFAILMPACDCEQGSAAATRIRRALATASMQLAGNVRVMISASFGLACSDVSGYDLTRLLADADAALYRAKRAGRNRLAVGAEA